MSPSHRFKYFKMNVIVNERSRYKKKKQNLIEVVYSIAFGVAWMAMKNGWLLREINEHGI